MNQLQARASYDAMQKYFYLPAHSLYCETSPLKEGDKPYSYLWSLREATAATIDMTRMPLFGQAHVLAVADCFKGLSNYWNASKHPPGYDSYVIAPLGTGGDIYYDDNAVVALELLRWYRMQKDVTFLKLAEQVFPLLEYGWDTDNAHPHPGGMIWTQSNSFTPTRGANVTGLSAQVALHLYEETKQPSYRDWGKKMYEWNRTALRSPEGLYWNDMDFKGSINKTFWIYNSGAMIGAATQLYRVTGEYVYLQNASQDADAALHYFGSDGRFVSQPAIFDAIFFKNLLLLEGVQHDLRYLQAMQTYVDQVWNTKRDPKTGLFTFAHPVPLLDQAAMVQISACLNWTTRDYSLIA